MSVTPSTLTFTSENWETPQTVTVSADQDADAADDTQTVGHAVADGSAAEYIGATIDDVQVTVTDDDAASVSIDPTELSCDRGRRHRRQLHSGPRLSTDRRRDRHRQRPRWD